MPVREGWLGACLSGFVSTPPRRRPKWTEPRSDTEFPSSGGADGAYWTETRDLLLAARAAEQGGVLTTSELRTCGFSYDAIDTAVRHGRLKRWGRGVYIVGPTTDALTEARAALAAVPGTLGFQAAGQVHRISALAVPPLSVIVAPDRHGSHPRVRVHRIALDPRDVMTRDGLKVTSPDVTVIHLARVLAPVPYERAVQEAFAKRLTNTRQLEHALQRHRGTAQLHRMLELGIHDLRSKAERSLEKWLRAAQLPTPSFNAAVGPWRVDALWPDERLAVEINGPTASTCGASPPCKRSTNPRS